MQHYAPVTRSRRVFPRKQRQLTVVHQERDLLRLERDLLRRELETAQVRE